MERVVKNKVIVFGRDNYNTLGLARQLGDANLDLVFLMPGENHHCATESKYCRNVIHVKDHQEAIDYLLSHFREEELKPIIVAGADLEAEALDQNRDELVKHYFVPGTMEQGLLTKVDDKNLMVKIAKEIGFNVPKSWRITAESVLPDDLVFPCFIKPAKFPEGHKKEFKMKKCDTRQQLEETLCHVRKDSVFILQEYIPLDIDLWVNGCRTWDKKITIAGTGYKYRFVQDMAFGHITKGVSELLDMNHVKAMMEKLDFYGVFSFEYGRYDGKAYFFETNLRNDGSSYSFYKSGANLPLLWVYSSAGVDCSQVSATVKNEVWYMDDLYDYLSIKKGLVTKAQWLKDKDKATVFKFFDKEDLGPWKYVYRRRHIIRAKKLLLDKYRPQLVKLLDRFHK